MQCKMAFGQHSQFCDVSYAKAILILKPTKKSKKNFKNTSIRLVCLREYIIIVFVNKIILVVTVCILAHPRRRLMVS